MGDLKATQKRPNVVVLFPDQLRAQSLPLYSQKYGAQQISTPHIDRLASQGVTLDNAISNCPVCTPARAMLVTGRYPQTTGHLINTTRTRHSEISIADAFANAGYKTAWIGKWHLHTGLWPALDRMPQHPDWVPEGRDRLGFEYWRAYNQHMVYFNGFVHKDDWNYERWEGYETDGLTNYAREFMEESGDDPFAPQKFYDALPEKLALPPNVPTEQTENALEMMRHYLAMILAVDEMLGNLLDELERRGLANNTIVVLASDHGTQGGSQGVNPWSKKNPYDASIHVPGVIRFPGQIEPGSRIDTVTSMVDWFPSICGLAGISVPRSIEGKDLSAHWRGDESNLKVEPEPESAFIMNFSKYFDWFKNGAEWRGVRSKTHTYAIWLDGREELYDLQADPLQMNDLSPLASAQDVLERMRIQLAEHQRRRQDQLQPCEEAKCWLDNQRRVVQNAFGELSHPESMPDWSLLNG